MLPIFYSDEFLRHQTGPYHPERPQRLQAIVQTLKASRWAEQLEWRLPTPVGDRSPLPWIERVHIPAYLQQVAAIAQGGGGYLDVDTVVSPASYQVALLAVNAWIDGVDYATSHRSPAFVLARPPGHHALRDRGMGFCIFANAAIAAYAALECDGVERVAILDWDVHHGNGTQALVESHPQIVYCSLHQSPCYPGTGDAEERGAYGNVLNLPLPAGSTRQDYEPYFRDRLLPFLQAFCPNLLIVSAGYDANFDDPLAQMALRPEDFGVFTEYCLSLTPAIVFGLEGGYDLTSLARSVEATLAPCFVF